MLSNRQVLTLCLCILLLATQMWQITSANDRTESAPRSWNNFLLQLTIQDYVFSPSISPRNIILKALINDHHQSFRNLYPTSSITPKMHYMVHYPECRKVIYSYLYVIDFIFTSSDLDHLLGFGVSGSRESIITSKIWLTG